ncbi:MAG: hypothetical protein LBI03_03605 [Clostridiales bacterium]|jgi:MFS family permease|nr:hypothetical protein [Clostridiales bacterium]
MVKNCIASVKRRPIILVLLAVFTLVISIAEQFNPLTKKIGSLSNLFKTDYLTHMANLLNSIKNIGSTPTILAIALLFVIILMFAIGSILGVILSGYFQVFYLSLFERKPKRGEFVAGINKHFFKMALMISIVTLITAIFLILAGFALVPAVSMFHVFMSGNSGVFYTMIILIILTAFIMFFSLVFFLMYLSYIFPSATAFKKGSFIVAFRMVNAYCWYLIPRIFGFTVLLIALQTGLLAMGYGLSSIGSSIGVILLNWILKTVILFPYAYFVFSTFRDMKDDMFTEAEPAIA